MGGSESQPVDAQLVPRMMQLTWGFMITQALHVAAKLAVVDALRDGPKTASELATVAGAQALPLRRLLRLLTTVDVLREDDRGRFAATPLGELLRADHPQSARAFALMYGEPFFWRSWGDLHGAISTGDPAFERVHGQRFFDYLASHPSDAAVFNAAMTSRSCLDLADILDAYDFSPFTRIVDVGGGHGTLLRGILERCPTVMGVLCDLPSVVAKAREIQKSAVAPRCELLAADMFQAVPAGGDAYVLKRILHDWSDAEAARILRSCRKAIASGGKLLVIEALLRPPNQPDPAKLMDLNMLVLLTGRERTEAEFRELYASAGFALGRVVPAGTLAILEGTPV